MSLHKEHCSQPPSLCRQLHPPVLPQRHKHTYLPMSAGMIPLFAITCSTAVAAMDTTSSLSPQKVIVCWPRPMVYLPAAHGTAQA